MEFKCIIDTAMLLRHNSCTVLPDLSNQERITHIRRDEAGKTYLLQTTATGFLTKLLGVESSCNRKHRIIAKRMEWAHLPHCVNQVDAEETSFYHYKHTLPTASLCITLLMVLSTHRF